MSETTCPVFYPTEEEFLDFENYVSKIESNHVNIGICKIIPPKSFRDNHLPQSYDQNEINNIKISYPARQIVTGRAGVYNIDLLEVKEMNVQKYRELAEKNSFNCDDLHERERKFWRTLGGTSGFADPIYGADVEGSLFNKDIDRGHSWNLQRLKNLLNYLPNHIPGVNTPMLYVGSWRAMFAYHCEDVDLYSINYLHIGEPKSWYCIRPGFRNLNNFDTSNKASSGINAEYGNYHRFNTLCNSYFNHEYNKCKAFMRHKKTIISPSKLKENAIDYDTAVQYPGEFVITFPRSYHAGFNHGFNIAEATNFATKRWIELGKECTYCNCSHESVKIDVLKLETILHRHALREKIRRTNTSCGQSGVQGETEDLARVRCICSTFEVERSQCRNILRSSIDGLCRIALKSSLVQAMMHKTRKNKSSTNNILHISESDKLVLEKEEYVTFDQCETCELFFHPKCVDVLEEYNIAPPTATSSIADVEEKSKKAEKEVHVTICHICRVIEEEEMQIKHHKRKLCKPNTFAQRKVKKTMTSKPVTEGCVKLTDQAPAQMIESEDIVDRAINRIEFLIKNREKSAPSSSSSKILSVDNVVSSIASNASSEVIDLVKDDVKLPQKQSVESQRDTKSSNDERNDASNIIQLKKNEEVVVRLPNNPTTFLTGIFTDFKRDVGRFHIKGSLRADDIWLSIKDCVKVLRRREDGSTEEILITKGMKIVVPKPTAKSTQKLKEKEANTTQLTAVDRSNESTQSNMLSELIPCKDEQTNFQDHNIVTVHTEDIEIVEIDSMPKTSIYSDSDGEWESMFTISSISRPISEAEMNCCLIAD